MRSLRVCLCVVLLSVSVQGYTHSHYSWSVSGADEVSAVEGASAVLPCTFTHPPINGPLTGSVVWYGRNRKSRNLTLLFNCTYPGPGPSRCDGATQEAGWGRFRFVGNLKQTDASIMVERLSREDGGRYRFRMEVNVGRLHIHVITVLTVTAPDGNGSVVTGTKGASATLPCVFTRSRRFPILHTVTWVRKDPYRHIVTFTHRGSGSWAAENGATRYELVGNPERGNASTRIKQLSVEDTGGYLCLVEFRNPDDDGYTSSGDYYRYKKNAQLIHLFQREVRLRVRAGTDPFPILMLCIPLGLKTLALLVMLVVYYSAKPGKRRD